jgi:16S rRNA (guanine527-N7)-methyltransferase
VTPTPDDLWQQLAARGGDTLDAARQRAILNYLDLLLVANEHLNLTRITDPTRARIEHVADALTLLHHVPPTATNLADVGSGGGVLGIVLAIVRPSLRVTLIESSAKKCAFLRTAIADLALSNVVVVNARAEETAAGHQRQSFDVVVVRAVAELVWLAEWCLPLLKTGGRLLAMKGPRHVEELPAAQAVLKKIGGSDLQVHPAEIAPLAGHVIVVIQKSRPTPAAYPRHPTIAKGRPL